MCAGIKLPNERPGLQGGVIKSTLLNKRIKGIGKYVGNQ